MMIKVCGMRDEKNIRDVEALGVDWMGFIFLPKSSRYVNQKPSYLPVKTQRVGVFVNEDIEKVIQTAKEFSLDIIQLHGNESPAYIKQLKGYRIIKAFNIATPDDLAQTAAYERQHDEQASGMGGVDYFLFDTKGKAVGGNGEKFNWEVLSAYRGSTPFLLSGGIGPDDVTRIRDFHHEKCVGIDLNSCFESSPGYKDIIKLKTFIQSIRQ